MYIVPAPLALEILGEVGSNNEQGEIYLTDVIAGLRDKGERVAACKAEDASLVLGVNSQEQLAEAEQLMERRAAQTAPGDR
jgi:bifunctional UDP-N-acetylglucosamine pyrophosphorylase/glucosamine-1-phosphate N-acetyltransferase